MACERVSLCRRDWAHVAYQAANSGGGRSGARDTSAGPDGCTSAIAGTGDIGAIASAIVGSGAWHELPHPQSNFESSATVETEAGAAPMSDAHAIVSPVLDISNSPSIGSNPEQPRHHTVTRLTSARQARCRFEGRRIGAGKVSLAHSMRQRGPPVWIGRAWLDVSRKFD